MQHFVCLVLHVDPHNHQASEAAVQRGLVLKRMHHEIQRNATVPVRRAFNSIVETVDNDDLANIPTFESIQTRAKRFRSRFIPPIPSTIDDVDINDDWAKTWKGQKFLSLLDNYWGIALFATKRMLKSLQKARIIYIDGTFRTAPPPYTQIVTIHGLRHGFVIPLAFCLLTGKTTGQYRQLFQHLKRRIRRITAHNFQPDSIVMDFEQGMITAVETELPATKVSGCYYHFTQSLWRHAQELGLSSAYRTNLKLKKVMRKCMALGYLPVLLVRNNFTNLRTSQRMNRLITRFPALDDWLDYIEETYVKRNALFATSLWNVYERTVDTRTNNHVEGKIIDII
jgi:hypothetical protein